MGKSVHPTAVVADGAGIAADVEIGPYCVIGGNVNLGKGCKLHSHVVIDGHTRLGSGNEVFPFAVLGLPPQHTQYKGENSTLEIGDNNIIRESVTMHPGTKVGSMKTVIGSNNMFFAASHVAHDCVIGDNVILTNDSMLGGHVEIDDFAYVGGNSAIKQFTRIGKHAMVSGMTGVTADVIPYGMVFGSKACLTGLNLVGMRRRGISREQVGVLRKAYRMLFAPEGTFNERFEEVREIYGGDSEVAAILDFIEEGGDKPLCQPERGEE